MHDSRAVVAIIGALRQVHGDDTARLMLQDGMTLEALIDALLCAPLSNRDSARLTRAALESGDFVTTPDFTIFAHTEGRPPPRRGWYHRPSRPMPSGGKAAD
jgi:hypothetical protein